jgi:hypothetical protein
MKTLNKEVLEIIESNAEAYDDKQDFFNDLAQSGCISGMISELIYYSDTCAFYERHKSEINQLLSELINSSGMSVDELFRDWDNEDPLALETQNQNILAWFAFEEMAQRING